MYFSERRLYRHIPLWYTQGRKGPSGFVQRRRLHRVCASAVTPDACRMLRLSFGIGTGGSPQDLVCTLGMSVAGE